MRTASIATFLAQVLERGIQIWFEGDTLRYRAGKSAMTAEVVNDLKAHKSKLRTFMGEGVKYCRASVEQRRMWLLDRMVDGKPLYNFSLAIRADLALDATALERALSSLVARHEILRTTFTSLDGIPAQVIHAPGAISMARRDAHDVPADERNTFTQALLQERAGRSFDLERGPLFDVLLLSLSGELYYTIVTVHHIIFDGWSSGVFAGELSRLYHAEAAGTPPELAPLPLQYADYAWEQVRVLASGRIQEQARYWQGRLRGAPPLIRLDADRPRPPVKTGAGALATFRLPNRLLGSLKSLCAAEDTTLYMAFLAGLSAFLYGWSVDKPESVVIGTVRASRDIPGTEALIGFLANTIAVRTPVDPQTTFRRLVARVREQTLLDLTHADIPFERVLEVLDVPRNPAYTPLFQVLCVFQHEHFVPMANGMYRARFVGASGVAKFDLSFYVMEADGVLEGVVEYSTDLFCEETVGTWLERLRLFFERALSRPDATVAELLMGLAAPSSEAAVEPAAVDRRLGAEEALPHEDELRAVFAELLDVPIGVIHQHDNFFALGGDSLRASQLLSRIHDAFGVVMSLQELMAAPTINGLAASILEEQLAGDEGLLEELENLSEEEAMRLITMDATS
jgi:acyl carrier protein